MRLIKVSASIAFAIVIFGFMWNLLQPGSPIARAEAPDNPMMTRTYPGAAPCNTTLQWECSMITTGTHVRLATASTSGSTKPDCLPSMSTWRLCGVDVAVSLAMSLAYRIIGKSPG